MEKYLENIIKKFIPIIKDAVAMGSDEVLEHFLLKIYQIGFGQGASHFFVSQKKGSQNEKLKNLVEHR